MLHSLWPQHDAEWWTIKCHQTGIPPITITQDQKIWSYEFVEAHMWEGTVRTGSTVGVGHWWWLVSGISFWGSIQCTCGNIVSAFAWKTQQASWFQLSMQLGPASTWCFPSCCGQRVHVCHVVSLFFITCGFSRANMLSCSLKQIFYRI